MDNMGSGYSMGGGPLYDGRGRVVGSRRSYFILKARMGELHALDVMYGVSSLQRKTPFLLTGMDGGKSISVWEVMPTLHFVYHNGLHIHVMPMFVDMILQHPHITHVALESTARYVVNVLNQQYAGFPNAPFQYVYHPRILDNQSTIYTIYEEPSPLPSQTANI